VDTATADPLIGDILDGRYRVDARVARGGMATVYTGFDIRLDRVVAVKVMHATLADDDDFVARFHREARAAAMLSHHNVVAIYDQGEDTGRVFLVMEHVSGGTLRDRMRVEGRLSPVAALGVMEPVLQALSAAHAAGLVHRDVKPENILITPGGAVKVADFGLARAVESSAMTTTGLLIGTVSYLAPEQVVTGRADMRSDVYAAGIVLFEMLTGAPPFDGETPLSVAYQHVNDTVPRPSSVLAGVPRELDDIVATATNRDPAERPADARELLAAVRRAQLSLDTGHETAPLRPLADVPTIVTPRTRRTQRGTPTALLPQAARPPAPPLPTAHHPVRRRRRPSAATVIMLVLALLLGAAALVGWQLGNDDETTATPSRLVAMPKLDGRTQHEAEALLAGLQIRPDNIKVVGFFHEDVPKDVVYDQSPKVADQLDPATAKVQLVVSKGKDRVKVPTLTGLTRAEAVKTLKDARLREGEIFLRYSETVPEGTVIATDPVQGVLIRPKPGTVVKPGEKVEFVVSRGRKPIKVPDVVGAKADAAEKRLEGLGLVVNDTEEPSETVTAGVVISQRPDSGTLFKGDAVSLVVSKGPPMRQLPNLVGQRREVADRVLRGLGLIPLFRDFEGEDDGGEVVFRQEPGAGQLAAKGSVITLFMV
jgi:serine/threonine-protein kinase